MRAVRTSRLAASGMAVGLALSVGTALGAPALNNTVSGAFSVIAGGDENVINNAYATIGGGRANKVTGLAGTISGGSYNQASATDATIGGGSGNQAGGYRSAIGGGAANSSAGQYSAVGGGGYANSAAGSFSTVGGGQGNRVTADYGTVAGGGQSTPGTAGTENRVTDAYGTVGGGGNNQAGDAAGSASDRSYATVGGGERNAASGDHAAVAGGYQNAASGASATVGGGGVNFATGARRRYGGGTLNAASGSGATVAGGTSNGASGAGAAVGGGAYNAADGEAATVAGGGSNSAAGRGATVPGGTLNVAQGDNSFAAGLRAKAVHTGVFVWADSTDKDFPSTAADQFSARATGGVRLVTAVDAGGAPTAGATLAPGSGSWSTLSDRNLKTGFASVDSRDVLQKLVALPVSTWSYTAQGTGVTHLGPTAQDFHAAFGLGENETTISTVDAQGVALAGIQGLYAVVQDKDARIADQQAQIDALRTDVTVLKAQTGMTAEPLGGLPELPLGWALLGGLALAGTGIGYGLRARR